MKEGCGGGAITILFVPPQLSLSLCDAFNLWILSHVRALRGLRFSMLDDTGFRFYFLCIFCFLSAWPAGPVLATAASASGMCQRACTLFKLATFNGSLGYCIVGADSTEVLSYLHLATVRSNVRLGCYAAMGHPKLKFPNEET